MADAARGARELAQPSAREAVEDGDGIVAAGGGVEIAAAASDGHVGDQVDRPAGLATQAAPDGHAAGRAGLLGKPPRPRAAPEHGDPAPLRARIEEAAARAQRQA